MQPSVLGHDVGLVTHRRQLSGVLAVLAALLLSACGGGSQDSGTTAGGPAATAPTTAAAPAPAGLLVGIGDQGAAMFTDKRFTNLKVKTARLVTSYDAARVRFERDLVDQWLAAAAAAGVEAFVKFGHSRVHPQRLPSVKEFRSDFRAFHKRYPSVTVYAPWNEINHKSQPTSDAPERAAQYYNVVAEECPKCTALAGDVLDQPGMVRYVRRYRAALKGTPKIWGLHNYADSNRFRDSGISDLLKTVRGDVWLTETGGIVQFGRNFPRDEQRAARAVSYAIDLARKHDRVKRIYLYNWTGAGPEARFDAGLIGPDGEPRPAYDRLRAALQE
jgi:hypothetical protein